MPLRPGGRLDTVAPVRGVGIAVLLGLAVAGCGGARPEPAPPPTPVPPAPTTTTAKVPALTAAAIPGLATETVHGTLGRIGFTQVATVGSPGFMTTTSTRKDATVSTYGTGPADVVKVIAEADTAAAPVVLVAVARTAVKGTEAGRVETWLKAELRKGPIGPTQPRTAKATYDRQPFELVVTASTATLGIGRLTS